MSKRFAPQRKKRGVAFVFLLRSRIVDSGAFDRNVPETVHELAVIGATVGVHVSRRLE
jgi:hypothetical protein